MPRCFTTIRPLREKRATPGSSVIGHPLECETDGNGVRAFDPFWQSARERQAQDNTREMTYDLFYVNGDNHLGNLRRSDQTGKVRLIEEGFQRLMFDMEDV